MWLRIQKHDVKLDRISASIRGDAIDWPANSPRELQILWHCRIRKGFQVHLTLEGSKAAVAVVKSMESSLMVTRFACSAHRFVSSIRCTRKSSAACTLLFFQTCCTSAVLFSSETSRGLMF